MFNTKRRVFLKGTLAGSAVAVAVGAGLLNPREVLAAWPKSAFEGRSVDDAMNGLFGNATMKESSAIEIKAPDIAENGSVVPVTVSSSLPNIESIAIVASGNQTPLAASFNLAGNTKGFVATRIKMGKTANVVAVVKAGGQLHSASKEVKVTIGGCGG